MLPPPPSRPGASSRLLVRLSSLAMTMKLSHDEGLIRGYRQTTGVCPHAFDQGLVPVTALWRAGR